MILAIAFLMVSIGFGWAVTRLLPMQFHRLEYLAFSTAIGMNLSAWIVFMVALIFGFRVGLPLSIAALVVFLALSLYRLKPRAKVVSTPYSTKWRFVSLFLALSTAAIVVLLTYLSYQFPNGSGGWTSNGNAFGDSPLHVAITNQLSLGNKLDLVSPIFNKTVLTYPLIADFYSSILRRLGASWQFIFFVPSALMILSLLQLVYSFGYRLFGSALAAWLQYLMLVLSGSFRGGLILGWVILTQGLDAYNAKVGNSMALSTGDQYLNFIHSHPLPQRAYLFGMPLLIVVLSITLTLYRSSMLHISKHQARVAGIIAGLLVGIMPLVHVHSYMIIVGLSVLATILVYFVKRALPHGWLVYLCVAGALSLPQFFWQLSHNLGSGFTRFIGGWMMSSFVETPDANLVYFWLSQLGILLLTYITGWFWLKKYRAGLEIWFFYIASILIFLICNIYLFQPTYWDNIKLFMYSFWFMMFVLAYIFAQWAKHTAGKIFVGLSMLSLTLYGFLNLYITGPKLSYEIISADDIAFAQRAQSQLPPNSFVIVGDRHSHPITMLTNHKVLISFGGWHNLYGSSSRQIIADRDIIMGGYPKAKELINQYGLTHAVFSDREMAAGTVNLQYFQTNFQVLSYDNGWWVFVL